MEETIGVIKENLQQVTDQLYLIKLYEVHNAMVWNRTKAP